VLRLKDLGAPPLADSSSRPRQPEPKVSAVNGISNSPKTGSLKFPSLAVSVVSRFSDLQLRSLADGRTVLVAAVV